MSQFTGACIVAIPSPGQPLPPTDAAENGAHHITLAWLGEADSISGTELNAMKAIVQTAAMLSDQFSVTVSGTMMLGKNDDVPVMSVHSPYLQSIRDSIVATPTVSTVMSRTEQFPQWIPHMTYNGEGTVPDQITISGLALWYGDSRYQYDLDGGEVIDSVVAAGSFDFDPSLHPRGADGRFIKKFSIIKFLNNIGGWEYGRVEGVYAEDGNKSKPKVVIKKSDLSGTVAEGATEQVLSPSKIYTAPKAKAKLSLKNAKKTGGQKGSNTGGTYQIEDPNADTTQPYYVKSAKTVSHGRNEALANALYEAAGVPVPEVSYNEDDGNIYSQIVAGQHDMSTKMNDPVWRSAVQKNYAVDAWLSNRDVFGLSYDNILTGTDGVPYRIDNGGALLYRAMGGKKTDFGSKVTELDAFRTGKKAAIYGHDAMPTEDELDGVYRVLAISPGEIDDLVSEHGLPKSLADTLKARRIDIANRYGLDLPEATKAPETDLPATTAPIVDAADLSGSMGKDRNWFRVPKTVLPFTLKSGDRLYDPSTDTEHLIGVHDNHELMSKVEMANQVMTLAPGLPGDVMVRSATGKSRPEHQKTYKAGALFDLKWQRGDRLTGEQGTKFDVLSVNKDEQVMLVREVAPDGMDQPAPTLLDMQSIGGVWQAERWDPPALPDEKQPVAKKPSADKVSIKKDLAPEKEKAPEPAPVPAPADDPAVEETTSPVKVPDKGMVLADGQAAKPGDKVVSTKDGKTYTFVKAKGPYAVVTEGGSDTEYTKLASTMVLPGGTVSEDALASMKPQSQNGMVPVLGMHAVAKDGWEGEITMISPDGNFVFITDPETNKRKRKSTKSVTVTPIDGTSAEQPAEASPEVAGYSSTGAYDAPDTVNVAVPTDGDIVHVTYENGTQGFEKYEPAKGAYYTKAEGEKAYIATSMSVTGGVQVALASLGKGDTFLYDGKTLQVEVVPSGTASVLDLEGNCYFLPLFDSVYNHAQVFLLTGDNALPEVTFNGAFKGLLKVQAPPSESEDFDFGYLSDLSLKKGDQISPDGDNWLTVEDSQSVSSGKIVVSSPDTGHTLTMNVNSKAQTFAVKHAEVQAPLILSGPVYLSDEEMVSKFQPGDFIHIGGPAGGEVQIVKPMTDGSLLAAVDDGYMQIPTGPNAGNSVVHAVGVNGDLPTISGDKIKAATSSVGLNWYGTPETNPGWYGQFNKFSDLPDGVTPGQWPVVKAGQNYYSIEPDGAHLLNNDGTKNPLPGPLPVFDQAEMGLYEPNATTSAGLFDPDEATVVDTMFEALGLYTPGEYKVAKISPVQGGGPLYLEVHDDGYYPISKFSGKVQNVPVQGTAFEVLKEADKKVEVWDPQTSSLPAEVPDWASPDAFLAKHSAYDKGEYPIVAIKGTGALVAVKYLEKRPDGYYLISPSTGVPTLVFAVDSAFAGWDGPYPVNLPEPVTEMKSLADLDLPVGYVPGEYPIGMRVSENADLTYYYEMRSDGAHLIMLDGKVTVKPVYPPNKIGQFGVSTVWEPTEKPQEGDWFKKSYGGYEPSDEDQILTVKYTSVASGVSGYASYIKSNSGYSKIGWDGPVGYSHKAPAFLADDHVDAMIETPDADNGGFTDAQFTHTPKSPDLPAESTTFEVGGKSFTAKPGDSVVEFVGIEDKKTHLIHNEDGTWMHYAGDGSAPLEMTDSAVDYAITNLGGKYVYGGPGASVVTVPQTDAGPAAKSMPSPLSPVDNDAPIEVKEKLQEVADKFGINDYHDYYYLSVNGAYVLGSKSSDGTSSIWMSGGKKWLPYPFPTDTKSAYVKINFNGAPQVETSHPSQTVDTSSPGFQSGIKTAGGSHLPPMAVMDLVKGMQTGSVTNDSEVFVSSGQIFKVLPDDFVQVLGSSGNWANTGDVKSQYDSLIATNKVTWPGHVSNVVSTDASPTPETTSAASVPTWDGDLLGSGDVPTVGMKVSASGKVHGLKGAEIVSISKDKTKATVLKPDGSKTIRQLKKLYAEPDFSKLWGSTGAAAKKDVPPGMALAVDTPEDALAKTFQDGKFRALVTNSAGVRNGEMVVTGAKTPSGKKVNRVYFTLSPEQRAKVLAMVSGSEKETGDWVPKSKMSDKVEIGDLLGMRQSSQDNRWKNDPALKPPSHKITAISEPDAAGVRMITLEDVDSGEIITSRFHPGKSVNTYTWDPNKIKPVSGSAVSLSDDAKGQGWSYSAVGDGISANSHGVLASEPGTKTSNHALSYFTGSLLRNKTSDGVVIEVQGVEKAHNHSANGVTAITLPEGADASTLNAALAKIGLDLGPMTQDTAKAKVRALLSTQLSFNMDNLDTNQGMSDEQLFSGVGGLVGLPDIGWHDVSVAVDESVGKVSYYWSDRVRAAIAAKSKHNLVVRAADNGSPEVAASNLKYGTLNAVIKRVAGIGATGASPGSDASNAAGHGGYASAVSNYGGLPSKNVMAGYKGGTANDGLMVYFRPEAILGQIIDVRAAQNDAFGNPGHGKNSLKEALNSAKVKDYYIGGGLSPEATGLIAVTSEAKRKEAIELLKKDGVTHIGVRPVESIIVTKSQADKMSAEDLPPVTLPPSARPIEDLPMSYDVPAAEGEGVPA